MGIVVPFGNPEEEIENGCFALFPGPHDLF